MAQSIRFWPPAAKALQRLRLPQRKKLVEHLGRLEQDPTLGDQIHRRLIPASLDPILREKNLWRLPLPEGWRALYSIQAGPEGATMILFLFIGTHKQYDRLMGYS